MVPLISVFISGTYRSVQPENLSLQLQKCFIFCKVTEHFKSRNRKMTCYFLFVFLLQKLPEALKGLAFKMLRTPRFLLHFFDFCFKDLRSAEAYD